MTARAPLATVTRLVPTGQDTLDPAPIAEVQGTLALDLAGAGLPAVPEYDEEVGSRLEAPHDTEVKTWSARFAQALVESLGGDRPVSQLVRWTTRSVFADLDRRIRLTTHSRGRRPQPRQVRAQVRSVHVFQPRPGCAEVSVVVRQGQRSRALAARLERHQGRWLCTALELG